MTLRLHELTTHAVCLTLLAHMDRSRVGRSSSAWYAIGRAWMEQRMARNWVVFVCVPRLFLLFVLVSGLGRLALMEELVPGRPPLSERCPISPLKAFRPLKASAPSLDSWKCLDPMPPLLESTAIAWEGSDCVHFHLHKRCIGIVHIFYLVLKGIYWG